jgi:uncharacterized cupredoxin-like copper-binding protein
MFGSSPGASAHATRSWRTGQAASDQEWRFVPHAAGFLRYVLAVLLLALSTSHKVGLGLAVAAFVGFALIASLVVPRWWPQFPGRGLTVFLIACVLMFLGMISAVEFLGREPAEAGAAEAQTEASTSETAATTGTTSQTTTTTGQTTTTTKTSTASKVVQASEVEFKIKLPQTSVPAGSYTFQVHNDGKVPHDLVIRGGGVNKGTPTIDPGKSSSLKVDLKPGTYDVYCSIPGHKQLGMDLTLTVT